MKRKTCISEINKIIKEFGTFDVFQVAEMGDRPQIVFGDCIWLAESFDIGEAMLLGSNDENEKRRYSDMSNDELKAILLLAERHKRHCQSLTMRMMMVDFKRV